ncbi:MAG: hypothetical protein V3R60_05135 [Acidobacteriota bacterium]
MQWLISLEMDTDPIAFCRLTDVFRRKGVKLASLAATSGSVAMSFIALVECNEALMEHMFHFLRHSPGIRKVSYYRNEETGSATLVFLTPKDSPGKAAGRILQDVPGARLVFSSGENYLFEFPAQARAHEAFRAIPREDCLPFAHVKTGGVLSAS